MVQWDSEGLYHSVKPSYCGKPRADDQNSRFVQKGWEQEFTIYLNMRKQFTFYILAFKALSFHFFQTALKFQ